MQARADLHRRRSASRAATPVSDTEQKETLREATRRLQVAEEKVALIKRLIPQLHHAIAEYHSHSQPLGDHLTGGFERSLASAGADGHRAGSLHRHHGPVGAAVRAGAPPPRAAPPRPAPPPARRGRIGRRSRTRPPPNRPTARPAQHRRRRPQRQPPAGPGRRARHRRLGEHRHECPIRPAPARLEEPARASGTSPRRPGTTPSPATSRRTTSSRWSRRQARDHRHGEALRDPRQAPAQCKED